MHVTRRARITALVAALFVGATFAACEPSTVVLTGTVATTSGPALPGTPVTIFDGSTETVVTRSAVTHLGQYRVGGSDLPAGTYRIKIDQQWAPSGASWAAATPVDVLAGTTTTVDVDDLAAQVPGLLGGTITGPADASGLTVLVYEAASGTLVSTLNPQADGSWTAELYQAGYRVTVVDPSGEWSPAVFGTSSTNVLDGTVVNATPTSGGDVDMTLTPSAAPTTTTTAPRGPTDWSLLNIASDGTTESPAISGNGRFVAMRRLLGIQVWDRDTQVLSTVAAGTGGYGPYYFDWSDDGSVLTFGDLSAYTPDDTNNYGDVFTWSPGVGVARLTDGNGNSSKPTISSDGRYVAFESSASNLVPGDTSGTDIFVKDLQTGGLQKLTSGNGASYDPAISPNGRYVSFRSYASDLIAGDDNGVVDIFTWDRTTSSLTRTEVPGLGFEVSVTSAGVLYFTSNQILTSHDLSTGTTTSLGLVAGAFDISADGSRIAATERVDLSDGTVEVQLRVITSSGSVVRSLPYGPYVRSPSIDADGTAIAFDYQSPVGPRSIQTRTVHLLVEHPAGSPPTSGGQGARYLAQRVSTDTSERASALSADGTTAAVTGTTGLVLQDIATGARTTVVAGSGCCASVSLSADGDEVAFTSSAPDLVPPTDANGSTPDAFHWDRDTGVLTQLTDGNGASAAPDISADGRWVTVQSAASNLVPGDTNAKDDIFVWDQTSGALTQITEGNGHSFEPEISGDGRYVAFSSYASDLAAGDTDLGSDPYLWDRTTAQITAPVDPASAVSSFVSDVVAGQLLLTNKLINLTTGVTTPLARRTDLVSIDGQIFAGNDVWYPSEGGGNAGSQAYVYTSSGETWLLAQSYPDGVYLNLESMSGDGTRITLNGWIFTLVPG